MVLMKQAHEAIFSAEQTTLANAGSPKYQPEVKDVEAKVSTLKDKIVQSTWHRNELKDSIEDLKTAHAKLNGKVEDEQRKVEAAKLVEEKKEQEDRKKKAEEAKRKKHGFVNLDKGDHEE
jgi:chromosome segregation ATPase